MTLRTTEQFCNNASLFSITTDEEKLKQLFHDIDFDDCGYINYSEFVAACLARKEGLRREYAELIFQLYAMGGAVMNVELIESTTVWFRSKTSICFSAMTSL